MEQRSKTRYNRIKVMLMEQERNSLWLATELGVGRTTVSKWCTNDNQPTIATLYRIAEALDVEVCSLLVPKEKVRNL